MFEYNAQLSGYGQCKLPESFAQIDLQRFNVLAWGCIIRNEETQIFRK
jgi:hypothetical protein